MTKTRLDRYIYEYKLARNKFMEGGLSAIDWWSTMRDIEELMGMELYMKHLDHLWKD